MADVVLYRVGADAADAPEEFSLAPEVPCAKITPQPGMVQEDYEGTVSFEALERVGDAERRRELEKAVDVVRHDLELDDAHIADASLRDASERRAPA